MKILFIGEYSNLHTTLARELRKMGHHADILGEGAGHMKLPVDIYLKREPGLMGSFKYLYRLFELLPRLKDYDVVQLINTNFLSLRPQKIKYFYDRLREQNKSIYLTLAGNDYYFCKACHDAKIFRYSEFKIGDEFTEAHKERPGHLYGWISRPNRLWAEYLLENITGAMAVLPEYEMPVKDILGERLTFTNLPIDLEEIPKETVRFKDDKVNILIGKRSGYEDMKGIRQLEKIAKAIEQENPGKVRLEIVKDLPFKEFLRKLSEADIVLDQLYAYSPAMTALYSMALGKVTGTGAQPEYYKSIGNPDIKPIFSLSPTDTDIKERLNELVKDREKIVKLGEESREIVFKHNRADIVAQRFLNHWKKGSQS